MPAPRVVFPVAPGNRREVRNLPAEEDREQHELGQRELADDRSVAHDGWQAAGDRPHQSIERRRQLHRRVDEHVAHDDRAAQTSGGPVQVAGDTRAVGAQRRSLSSTSNTPSTDMAQPKKNTCATKPARRQRRPLRALHPASRARVRDACSARPRPRRPGRCRASSRRARRAAGANA